MSSLIVYGHPASQPSRTVFWSCLLENLQFTLGSESFDTEGKNPRGQVPTIDDGRFVLSEMAAIVCYLADKHGWGDLYPNQLQERARINQFMHMHHSLVRMATLYLMAPHVMKPLGATADHQSRFSVLHREVLNSAFATDNPLKEGGEVVKTIVDFLEQHYFIDRVPFVCQTEVASIADLVCYSELGQLRMAHLFDFTPYPRTLRWMDAMTGLPHHDVIHAYNIDLGDLAARPNTIERFQHASEVGFSALRSSGRIT